MLSAEPTNGLKFSLEGPFASLKGNSRPLQKESMVIGVSEGEMRAKKDPLVYIC